MSFTLFQQRRSARLKRGSSLVEVLAVLLILVIIAAIFTIASHHLILRAKYTKVLEDQRYLRELLQGYWVDHGVYPTTEEGLDALTVSQKRTHVPKDPFAQATEDNVEKNYYYFRRPLPDDGKVAFLLAGWGPDGKLDVKPYLEAGSVVFTGNPKDPMHVWNPKSEENLPRVPLSREILTNLEYDPTNGLNSKGDVLCCQE